jgi:hypothetical protein
MAGTPELEHRGYVIRYSENDDVWRCYDINYQNVSVGKVKAKIDAVEREHRKMARPVIQISHGGEAHDCVLVSLDESKDRCWITKDVKGAVKREKTSISQLADPTPEVRAMVADMQEKHAAYMAAMRAHSASRDAIPRLTRELLITRGVKNESEGEQP